MVKFLVLLIGKMIEGMNINVELKSIQFKIYIYQIEEINNNNKKIQIKYLKNKYDYEGG